MIHYLTKLYKIQPGKRITLPHMNKYLKHIDVNVASTIANYRNNILPIPTKALDLLNGLLIRADLNYLLSKGSDIATYEAVQREYIAIYTNVLKQYPFFKKLFTGETDINEVVIFSDMFDILDKLPIDSDDWNDWRDLAPVRIISNYCREYSVNVQSTRLAYNSSPPSEMIISINIPMLLMMYLKYRKLFPEEFSLRTDNYPFLYRYCIVPMLKNLSEAWVFNLLNDMLDDRMSFGLKFNATIPIEKYSYFANSYLANFIEEMNRTIREVVDRKLEPSVFLNSVKLSSTKTLAEFMNELPKEYYIQNTSNNLWLGFIRDYQAILMLKNLYHGKKYKTVPASLKRIERVINRASMTNTVRDPLYRELTYMKLDYLFF